MEKFLGETPIEMKRSKIDWALSYIVKYGGIDGAHHKDWVLDQVARILCGTPVIATEAAWSEGSSEIRTTLAEPSKKYLKLVADVTDGDQYEWNEGIAP